MTVLEVFHDFNKRYFGNSLPVPSIRWEDFKHFGQYYPISGGHVIELAEWTRKNKSIWKFTLLHEMVHLLLHDKKCAVHGRLFQKEMRRLANLGAFNKFW